MWLFISLQGLVGGILQNLYGPFRGMDIYRSSNCLCLSLRGVYCLAWTNVQESLETTCIMYISYTCADLYYLLLSSKPRLEIGLHHIFTIMAYLKLNTCVHLYQEALMAHIFLMAELLSVCNVILRRTKWLRYWRMGVITLVRLPIWTYMIYSHSLLSHERVAYLMYRSGMVLMPLLDVYFMWMALRSVP